MGSSHNCHNSFSLTGSIPLMRVPQRAKVHDVCNKTEMIMKGKMAWYKRVVYSYTRLDRTLGILFSSRCNKCVRCLQLRVLAVLWRPSYCFPKRHEDGRYLKENVRKFHPKGFTSRKVNGFFGDCHIMWFFWYTIATTASCANRTILLLRMVPRQ